MAGRSEVLHLYRTILTRGKALRYTDGDYFRRQVRQEFKKGAESTDSTEIEVQIEVMATASVEHYCPCAIAARLRLCIVLSPDLLNPVLSLAVLTFVLQTTSGEVMYTLRYVYCLSSSPQQPVSVICGYSNSYFLQEGLGSSSFMDPRYTVHVFHAVLGHWYPYTIHRSESAMHYLAISIVTDCSLISDPLED